MLHFVAAAVMASAVAQTGPDFQQPQMVRATIAIFGKQKLSLELPSTWQFGPQTEKVKEGGLYDSGRFGVETPEPGDFRIRFSIYHPPFDGGQSKKRLEEYLSRAKRLVNDHVKAGEYEGYVVQVNHFAKGPKFRTKYEIYLGNPKGHIFYVSMQSFAPEARASDKELFKRIVGSIRISPTI